MKGCFGENINTSMDTPQGQLVTTLSAVITDERNFMINLLNSFDPRYASCQMQDALGYIYFMQRKQATPSVAELTFNGLSGVVIPANYQVSDDRGLFWSTSEESVINDLGVAVVKANCLTSGAIDAPVGVINRLTKSISGLDSVSNRTAGVPGRNAESRQEFEYRRSESVAKNAKNTNSATYGAVANLKGVIDCYVVDNPSDETIQVGKTKYSLIRNSIAVSVVGGDNEEIAQQILTKAGTGCSFVGNTTVTYEDKENFPCMPPKYTVKFIRPSDIAVTFTITVEDKTQLTHQAKQAIIKAITEEFMTGRGKGQIGKRLIASDYVCGVAQATTSRLINIQVGRKGSDLASYIDFGIDEFPVLSVDDIRIE
ncbi:baseplate J/gp47 family protein [Proteus mirabilis]|uniref:baseplate J/gp47 family protein n=1 Tax=Proteus mirabilis TaxID=584 RepID=UPI0038A31D32